MLEIVVIERKFPKPKYFQYLGRSKKAEFRVEEILQIIELAAIARK